MKTFIVRYNVEFSRKIEADSEQDAVERVMQSVDDGDEGWDQKATSQYEAEEAEPEPIEPIAEHHHVAVLAGPGGTDLDGPDQGCPLCSPELKAANKATYERIAVERNRTKARDFYNSGWKPNPKRNYESDHEYWFDFAEKFSEFKEKI